jgi:hypothetical protein
VKPWASDDWYAARTSELSRSPAGTVNVTQSCVSVPPATEPMIELTPWASVNWLGAAWLLDRSPLTLSFHSTTWADPRAAAKPSVSITMEYVSAP